MTMNKTLLTAAVLGALSAAVSSAAFAMDNTSTYCKPGFYAGVSGGRSDTFYSAEKAFGVVAYNGSDSNSYATLGATSIDDIGLGGRIYGGYQFNPYFALETGYTKYAKTDFSGVGKVYTKGSNALESTTSYSGEITEQAVDLVAKGTLPLQGGFGVFAKAGMALITADNHINENASTTGNLFGTTYTSSWQGFRPVAGAGVAYTIPNTNLNFGGSYTRVFSYGAIPNAALISADLEYKFA